MKKSEKPQTREKQLSTEYTTSKEDGMVTYKEWKEIDGQKFRYTDGYQEIDQEDGQEHRG